MPIELLDFGSLERWASEVAANLRDQSLGCLALASGDPLRSRSLTRILSCDMLGDPSYLGLLASWL